MDTVDSFKKYGYGVYKNALSKEIVDLISQYAIFDEMQKRMVGDKQVPNAHSKYADPAMESILLKIHPLIENITSLKLFPTYSYYRVYRNNDELIPHIDRESCEISATLSFNFSYKNRPWPIYMNNTEISLEPGDLAVYRGCDIEHYRNPLVCADTDHHIQGFFHYVDANGPYADFMYDKRKCIGSLKETKKYIIHTYK